jgi:cell division protein FtsI/penicillin-binding protein 2
MARFMAAIAAGGSLVTPHVLQSTNVPPEPVRGLSRSTIAVIQSGMLAATSEAGGVAHASVSTDITTVAGLPAEAWFAGYFPADRPRFAIVVAIEPSADLATIICPVVRRLVLQMETLGLLGS